MATINNLLKSRGYTTVNIPQAILDMEINCNTVETVGFRIWDLFYGYKLPSKDGKLSYSINLEYNDNEFTPLAIFHLDEDGYIVGEVGYDENLNEVYANWDY